MLVVGLTGGIASGKTAAAEAFARRGVPVVDTDELAREVVAPGTAGLAEVVDAFGKDVLAADGTLDRARLRQRVFADAAALARLEAITHPRIEALARERLAAATGPYAILVVPLLVEKGWQHLVDRVLVVDAAVATQRQRLMARDGIDRDAADAVLARQATRADRLAAADDVIENDGDRAALEAAVAALDQRYRRLSG
ncbi:dephospho-CoA kinase [Spiribacter halobius]|nr:dephospho-CoA kinase [Spiribacter halobius]UEX79860.1 dephospho-CoA kinase [Spiribacter halobius]